MNRLKLVALAILAGSLTTTSVRAQDEALAYHPYSFSAEVGSLGVGGNGAWRFSDHFGVRAGISFFELNQDNEEISGISYDTKNRLLVEPIGIDYYPWRDKSYRLTLGVMINQNDFTGNIPNPGVPGTVIQIGANTYDVYNDLGNTHLKVDQQSVFPYLSIGADFYLDKAKHWSLGGEVGVAYTGSPDAALTISNPTTAANPGFQADQAAEESQIENELDKYEFYPIVKLSVTYSF